MSLAEPYSWTTAVLVDELHSSAFKRPDNSRHCGRITGIAASFNIAHCVSMDLGGFGEVAHAPI
jgi:hypothetical protein